jgi:hypothetical protein
MRKNDETMDEVGPDGQKRLSKYSDEGDVEGHKHMSKAIDDEVGPDGQKRMVSFSDEDDVEGHRAHTQKAIDDEVGPDGLYRSGPTTQGEVIRRGPGDNPNGDR